MRIRLKTFFWISFSFTLFAPLFFPKLPLIFFAPYLVTSYYKCARISSVYRSFFCGLFLDLLSSSYFGMSAINYSLTSFLLYGQKRNFFEDKSLTLPFMTFLFSMLSTFISLILLLFFGQKLQLSLRWWTIDFLGLAFLDGAFAFVFFSLPFQLTEKISRMRLFRNTKEDS